MDSVFLLEEADLSTFFQHMTQDFGCTYLCLWLYSPQHPQWSRFRAPEKCILMNGWRESRYLVSCLRCKNGFYIERSTQPSSSSGTLAKGLFVKYQQSVFMLETSHIPGLAFQNNLPYMELHFPDLLTLATTESQRQFYQEAGIKTAVVMGCKAGEIEMGFSDAFQVNFEMQMRSWFPEDFSRAPLVTSRELPRPVDQNLAASSSSSLRSLSYDSPEYSPLLFDITQPEAILDHTLRPAPSSFTLASSPLQQATRAPGHMHNIPFPTIGSADAAITQAILAVISSASASSSTLPPQQNVSPAPSARPGSEQRSAFKWYRRTLGPSTAAAPDKRRQNMLKRSISFLRTLVAMRAHEQIQVTRPSGARLHHMIAERKRREKINESFQTLRSLLPPGTKKDKASVLASTTEYMSSLRAQVEELSKRNQVLEAQPLHQKEAVEAATLDSSNERVDVRITHVGESTSEARTMDLHVTTRGESSLHDNVVSLLEFLRRDQHVSLMSIEANTTAVDSTCVNRIVLRLKIEGSEWDESTFQEAITKNF